MTFNRRYCLLATAIVTLTSLQTVMTRGQSYSITPLGTLGGTSSYPCDINSTGQIVGYSLTTGIITHGFLYSGGTIQDLGTLGGTNSYAYGINDHGDVVGKADTITSESHAFLYSAETMSDLAVQTNLANSVAFAINNSGQIVGRGTSAGNAFLYSGGSVTDLGGTGKTTAYAINADSCIVGELYPIDHAFLYMNNVMSDLGSVGSSGYSTARDINDFGSIVGFGLVGGSKNHAFLYDTQMHDLGEGEAYGINNLYQIVGGFPSSSGAYHAGLYSNGVLYDLNDLVTAGSGWTLTTARAINDKGWIAAYGTDPAVNGGSTQALLLTPLPEPGTLSLTLAGALLVTRLRPRKPRRS
jgi:probable HAF family extracellular repeat protein